MVAPATKQLAHFRILRPIGGGAMADVYEAEDTRTGEVVALKVLGEHVNATSEAVARFVREARALQNLQHENIVRVLDHGITDDGDAWMALERLHGVSLDALIRDEGRLHPARALHLVHDVANALATVHARGLLHRDIKPENVFVVLPDAPQEHAKLIDFGVARVSRAELGENSVVYTRMNTMIGTAAFAAPEQMRGVPLSPQADIFSVGVTAYEMLTGKLPFAGDTMKEQLSSKLAGRIVPLASRVRDGLDPELERIVMRCLAVDPAARPRDGRALMEEIAACIGRAGPRPSLLDPPPSSPISMPPSAQAPSRALVYAAAGAAFVLAAVGMFLALR